MWNIHFHAPLWYILWSFLEFVWGCLVQRIFLFLEWIGAKKPASTRREEVDIKGKVVVVTGAGRGLGKCTAKEMAKRGAIVVMACRDLKKGEKAREEIMDVAGCETVELYHLEISDPTSVRLFADKLLQTHPVIDILVNNAGISLNHPKLHLTPKNHWELHMATNHLGHFLLTNLLIPSLIQSSVSRVVSLSSTSCIYSSLDPQDLMLSSKKANKFLGFMNTNPYINSKFAQALFTSELHNRYSSSGLKCYTVCPGLVSTDLLHDYHKGFIMWPLIQLGFCLGGQPLHQGVDTIILCALSKQVEDQSGKYFRFGKHFSSVEFLFKEELAKRVWKASEEFVDLQVDKRNIREEVNGNILSLSPSSLQNNNVNSSKHQGENLNKATFVQVES